MTNVFFRGIVTASAMAVAWATPGPARAEWLEATSEQFTVIGDMSESDLRQRTRDLEQYSAMLSYVLGVREVPRVTIFIVDRLGDVQQFMPGRGGRMVAGFYDADAQRAFAVVPKRLDYYVEDFSPQVVLFHEYAHHMLLSNIGVFMPGWAQEGLAEMFATAKIGDDGSVTIGDKNDARGWAMFGPHRWSVERMLDSDFHPPESPEEGIEKYSRGWALAHYLWMSGERKGQYVAFIKELNRTADPVASGKKAFGDLRALDRELDQYIKRHKFNLSRFSAQQIGAVKPIAVRSLGADEAAILPYRMASAVGVTEETAPKLEAKAAQVDAEYPASVPVQLAMAEIHYDAKNYAAAEAAADRVLAQRPDDLLALVYKARIGIRRAVEAGDATKLPEARRWALQANRAHPDEPLPFVVYYDSFGALGQAAPADAVAGLFRAMVLAPQDQGVRIRASLELLKAGELDRARAAIAPTAFQAEGTGRNKPLELVTAMEETKDTAALLAKARELKLDRINEFLPPIKDDPKDGDS